MKLLINTATTHKGGGVQVARSFIEECRRFPEHEFHVVLGEMLSELVNQEEFPANFMFYNIGYRPATRVFSLQSQDQKFRELEMEIRPDIVFTTTGPAYWRPKAPHLVGFNRAHHIYRDSPFFSKMSICKKIKWYLKGAVLKYFFKRDADAYVVQTEDVNRRLQKWLQTDEVYTVSNTFSQYYESPRNEKNKLPEKTDGEFRFLTLSAWYPHKNLEIIPDVITVLPAAIKERIRFVLTLPEDDYRKHFPEEMDGTIINIGPVKPEEGPSLYQECDALFLPTLLECFSASYAEAMKMEKPIITSDLGFAHTICGDAALYADPMDPHAFAEKIINLVEDPRLQTTLVQNGIQQQRIFATARERAEQYLTICKKLANAENERK
ncbi:glycosyltransferase family 4 protein [Halalkalibaculum sp. DA384]|uniref:glycosyltransferase family 4 protein n=1 Tax=Halalkalibaculum sp. DA384 TaxID=3373606 RepID=UPI003754FB04